MNEEVSAESIKNKFLGIEEDQQTLIGLCDYHNEEMKDVRAWGTLKIADTYVRIFSN
ncbi:MAG: hypothetical protein RIC35_15465 [Marinoscillum sp.]